MLASSLLSYILTLSTLILNVDSANVSGAPLPNPLPDTCLLVGSDPPVACKGACPPCWVVNLKSQVECYDYEKGTKQCIGWQGMEDVSQRLIDRAKQKGYYNATALPSSLTAKPTGTSIPGSSGASTAHGANFLVLAAGLLLTSTLY